MNGFKFSFNKELFYKGESLRLIKSFLTYGHWRRTRPLGEQILLRKATSDSGDNLIDIYKCTSGLHYGYSQGYNRTWYLLHHFHFHKWLQLFDVTTSYDLVYSWFDILAVKGHTLNGFVIMPNHLHMLLYYSGGLQSLNTIVGNGKRFMAYDIVDRLKNHGNYEILNALQRDVNPKDHSRGKRNQVWKSSLDVKPCRTEKFVLQKLNYMHYNPCVGRWKLVKEPHHYLHSSALFYLNGKTSSYPVRDYRDFLSLCE